MPQATERERLQRRAFGDRVRQLRKQRSRRSDSQPWSQEDLAHATGLDRTYIGGIEQGRRNPSLDNIYRIATALGVDVATLFTGDPSSE